MQIPPVLFASRIRFVSETDFERRLPGMAPESDNLAISKDGFTRGIIMCNGGGVTNGQRAAIYHFYDAEDPRPNIDKLAGAIRTLRAENPKLRAMLVGGQSRYETSRTLGKMLKELFSRENIPFSLFWGHTGIPSSISDIAYTAADDTWTIHTTLPVGRRAAKDCLTRQDLETAFEEIRVDDGDELLLPEDR